MYCRHVATNNLVDEGGIGIHEELSYALKFMMLSEHLGFNLLKLKGHFRKKLKYSYFYHLVMYYFSSYSSSYNYCCCCFSWGIIIILFKAYFSCIKKIEIVGSSSNLG